MAEFFLHPLKHCARNQCLTRLSAKVWASSLKTVLFWAAGMAAGPTGAVQHSSAPVAWFLPSFQDLLGASAVPTPGPRPSSLQTLSRAVYFPLDSLWHLQTEPFQLLCPFPSTPLRPQLLQEKLGVEWQPISSGGTSQAGGRILNVNGDRVLSKCPSACPQSPLFILSHAI